MLTMTLKKVNMIRDDHVLSRRRILLLPDQER